MKKSKNKKRLVSDIITVLIILVGAAFLGYPTFSEWWNSLTSSKVISNYDNKVSKIDSAEKDKMFSDAQAYNERLLKKEDRFHLDNKDEEEYKSLLNMDADIIGVLDIPKIDINLPIYHGASDSVLQAGIGHMPGTSLPVGGESTHSALLGHSGLPSAKLITGLDEMENGDCFMLKVLGKTLTYQVDSICVVEPDDLKPLEIENGRDLCTVITCTPYGVNTHRLMVRGHRIPNLSEDSLQRQRGGTDRFPMWIVLVGTAVILVIIIIFIRKRIHITKQKKSKQQSDDKLNDLP